MTRKLKAKVHQVAKFGGTEELGSAMFRGDKHEVSSIEVNSDTKLQQDKGEGKTVLVRCFVFAIDPETFKVYTPTKQELFNSHYKGIETALWRDGMKVIPEVNPRIVVMQQEGKYRIFVGAQPMKGHILKEQPKTLTEQIHGGTK